jgi:hypothetical protein
MWELFLVNTGCYTLAHTMQSTLQAQLNTSLLFGNGANRNHLP